MISKNLGVDISFALSSPTNLAIFTYMNRNLDLQSWLREWPYDPDHNVRLIRCADGREVIQVRQPLGIEQYETQGRPDGTRPHDMESALDHHMARLVKARAEGLEDTFKLSTDDCADLFDEGVQYYYRYFYFFQLEEWERTVRDTERNLRMFDFVHRYAALKEDRLHLEQWRPYILRMNAVARVMIALDKHQHTIAAKIITETIETIENLEDLDNPTFEFEKDRSLTALRELAGQVEKDRPLSPREKLERDLQAAVESEHFERAAQLRDQLRKFNPR